MKDNRTPLPNQTKDARPRRLNSARLRMFAVVLTVFVVAGLMIALSISEPAHDLEIGAYLTEDVYATRDIYDEEATNLMRLEASAEVDRVYNLDTEIYTSLQDPMSPFWFSEELRLWICYITGFSWDELTNRNRPQDRETLVATRHSICSIMKEQIHPYVQLFLQQLSSMVEDINNTSEKENKRSLFAFMGVTHEVIVEKTTENMSFLERVKRIL